MTAWRPLLDALRGRLPAEGGGGPQPGSLRWLESAMLARGAGPSAVRNIVYRGVGTPADKRALFGLICELYAQAGLPAPPPPEPLAPDPTLAPLELLGCSKRGAYRQFMAGLRAGRAPRLIVAGRAGVGKTLLLDHLARQIAALPGAPPVTRLSLGADAVPDLARALAQWGRPTDALERLHAGLPFALQAALQADAAGQLRSALRGVLLLRVAPSGELGGTPPRGPDGAAISLPAWAHAQLFTALPPGVATLLAVEDAAAQATVLPLRPPGAEEIRRHLRARLPQAPAAVEELLRACGGNLDRLALLTAVQGLGEPAGDGADEAARILTDPDTRALLLALSVGQAPGERGWSRWHLEAALGRPLDDLPPHARALLDQTTPEAPRPVSRGLLPLLGPRSEAHELNAAHARAAAALDPAPAPEQLAALAGHLAALGDWAGLVAQLERHPAGPQVAPGVWPLAAPAPPAEREALARAVVRWHARLGQYDHPQVAGALDTLLASGRPAARAWARVKLAEREVEAAAFDEAEAQLAQLDPDSSDPWWPAIQADAALVQAAVARWRGDLAGATQALQAVPDENGTDASSGARVQLWRGLIAKDRGDWPAAVRWLAGVPAGDALQHARARYQLGDLRLRLGQPAAALEALDAALLGLSRAQAPDEERARVLARSGTALRRLGRLDEAQSRLDEAATLTLEAEPTLRARVRGEAVPLLLAQNRPGEALHLALEALDTLASARGRPAEVAYRVRRSRYRLALAYLTRGVGQPYLQPFSGAAHDHPDLAAARTILDDLLAAPEGHSDRERVLTFDMRLSRSLAEPDPVRARTHAEAALAMTDHPYAESQARATLAGSLLRAGQPGAALAEVNRAHALLRRVGLNEDGSVSAPDPGLAALLYTLEARVGLAEAGDLVAPLRWLAQALRGPDLAPFCAGVWREVGLALEAHGERGWQAACGVFPPLISADLRLPDALVQATLAQT